MNKVLAATMAVSIGAGTYAGYAAHEALTPTPMELEQAALETHDAGVDLLEVAPDQSCEQNVIHVFIDGNRKGFPEDPDVLVGKLDEICPSGENHNYIASVAIDGFSELYDKQEHQEILEGKVSDDIKNSPILWAATGAAAGTLGGIIIYAAGAVAREDIDERRRAKAKKPAPKPEPKAPEPKPEPELPKLPDYRDELDLRRRKKQREES